MNIQGKKYAGELLKTERDNLVTLTEKLEEFNGMYELSVSKPTRTVKQNKTIHALFKRLAFELNCMTPPVTFSVGSFNAEFTPVTAKEFFKLCYLNGKKTSKCTTEELSLAIQSVIIDVNRKGGSLHITKDELDTFK